MTDREIPKAHREQWAAFVRKLDLEVLARKPWLAFDVDHEQGCPRPLPEYRPLGERVGGDRLGELTCPLCGARRVLVNDRPEAPTAAAPERPGPNPAALVTREEVERTREALAAAGKHHGLRSIAKALGASASTVRRRPREPG